MKFQLIQMAIKQTPCARIGIVGDNHDPNNPNIIPGSRDIRMRAAKETILAAGLPFDERRDFIKSSWSIDGGIEAGRGLAKKGKCKYDGLYCLNDGIALGILRGLADDGVSVPGDVRVIGFDGLSQSMYSVPTLTTVATDFKGMADTALTLLMRRIENLDDEFFPQTVNVGYKLIERESTAA